MVSVSVFEDEVDRRFFQLQRELVTDIRITEGGPGTAGTPRSFMIDGHAVRIADLVDGGLLASGTEIVLTIGGTTTSGVIPEDGNIVVGDQRFPTPSAAGNAAVGHSVDGWVKWKVPSLNSQSLADLRNTLLERVSKDEA